jgi:hypothetical protein
VRTIPALLVTIGLAAALTGCATASGAGTSASCIQPGKASDAVSATGAFGSAPKVDVPADLTTTGTQVSVLSHGDGRQIGDGTPALIEYSVVDGQTGKTVQTSGYDGKTAPITAGSSNAGEIGKAIECAHVGDRLAVVTSRSALSGGSATTKPGQDAAVVVIDVKRAYDSRATGTPQLAGDNMPAVVLAPDGAPGITVPSSNPPKSDETHLLRKGHGAELTAEDTAIVKYTAVTWGGADSSVAGSSWTDGSGAVTVPLAKGGQIQEGIRGALDGAHVGDQILAIVDQNGTSYAYVFDVLGAMPR